ncbi:MAG: hypothetical protein ACE5GX_07540 [Thermoanaerobaculia bacterium]
MNDNRRRTWQTARDETLKLWFKIRSMADEPDEIALLTEINALCALCEAANAEGPKTLTCCERCLAFQQFGGCRGVNLEMSIRVVDRDWDGLRELVDLFIDHLKNLELPAERTKAG